VADRLNELLAELGERSGTELRLDKTGECVLEDADGSEVVINEATKGTAFALSAVVGSVLAADRASLLTQLLQLNGEPAITHGGTLSLDDGGDTIVYRYLSDAADLDADTLDALIENFFALAEALGAEIDRLRGDEESTAPPAALEPAVSIIRG
jgi:hypothetical protein